MRTSRNKIIFASIMILSILLISIILFMWKYQHQAGMARGMHGNLTTQSKSSTAIPASSRLISEPHATSLAASDPMPQTRRQKADQQAAIENMRRAHLEIAGATDNHDQARAWLALQRYSDELTEALGDAPQAECRDPKQSQAEVLPNCPGAALVKEANTLGASISYCDAGEGWLPGTDGYASYLKLWPDGPDADRAWWRTRVEPACCDECAPARAEDIPSGPGIFSREDLDNLIDRYSEFAKKFPNSTFRPEAEEKLRRYLSLLKVGQDTKSK